MSSPSIESLLKTTREQLTLLTKSTTPNLSPLPIPPSPDIEDLFLRNLGLSSAVGSIVHGEQLKEVLIDRLRAIQAEIAAAKPEPEIEPEQQPPPSSHSTSFSSSSSSDLEVSFKPPPPPSQTTTALETETLFQLSASTFFSHVNAASLALSNNDSDETPDFLACARNIKLAEQQREAAMRCSETCTDNNDDNDDILQSMDIHYSRLVTELTHSCGQHINNSIIFTPTSITASSPLSDSFLSLESFNLDQILETLSTSLHSKLLEKLLVDSSDFASLLSDVEGVLAALHGEVFKGGNFLAARIGLFDTNTNAHGGGGGLADGLARRLLECVPTFDHSSKDSSKQNLNFPDFKLRLTAIKNSTYPIALSFERKMYVMGFLPTDPDNCDGSGGQLSKLANEIDDMKAYATGKKTDFLVRARSLILGEDESAPAGNVVTVGEEVEEIEGEGEEDYFKFKKCQVMAIAKKVVELCEEAKQFEAEFSDCEPTSTSTSTTILQLFKLLVPRQQSQAIKTSPKRCAVFHNSCLFLAHSSVTLNPSFLSLYPSFTRLGCDALADLIDGQREEIESVVRGGMERFGEAIVSGEECTEIWADVAGGVEMGNLMVSRISAQFSNVLNTLHYNHSVGKLIDAVFGALLEVVMMASDVSAVACEKIEEIFEGVGRAGVECLKCCCSQIDKLEQMQIEIARENSSLFEKFDAVGKFFSMNLNMIGRKMVEGGGDFWRSLTKEEMRGLVEATFGQSEKRDNVLKALV